MNEKTKETNEIGDNATAGEVPVEKSEELSSKEQEEVAGGAFRKAGGSNLIYG
jgi:hypothetical protein